MEASKVTVDRIDVNVHKGAHPRIGAVDVIPFPPGVGPRRGRVRHAGQGIRETPPGRVGVLVYFYENTALRLDRHHLEVICKSQIEALRQGIVFPERHPDVGEPKLHPTAGSTVIGVRRFLLAFNMNQNSTDIGIAKEIARRIWGSGGGFS